MDFGNQLLMLGKVANKGIRLKMPTLNHVYQLMTSMGGFEMAKRLVKHNITILVNLNHLKIYMIVQACAMVTNATSYDIIIKCTILYPLGFNLDFWE